jgi:hypothetical protein
MEIEFNTLDQGMYLSLMMIKVIALIFILFTIAGFAIYLAGIAWLCFKETRASTTARPAACRDSALRRWTAMPLAPDSQVGAILSTSHALICKASQNARARFEWRLQRH